MADENGWNQWSRHVLRELERLDANVESIKKEVIEIKGHIIEMKERIRSKSIMWGALGAIIPATVAIVMAVLI